MKPPERDAERRQPLLIDRLLARSPGRFSQGLISEKTIQHVLARARQARVFVLDEPATQRFAQVVRDVPDLIVGNQQFARAPYDLCWIEFPFTGFWEAVTGRAADETSDARLGYLIDHGTVYVAAGGTRDNPAAPPSIVPVRYHMHEEWPIEEQLRFTSLLQTSRMQLDAWMWGESITKLDKEAARGLRDNNRPELLFDDVPQSRWPEMFIRSLVSGASGDARNIAALLLMMNRPSLTRFVRDLPARRGFLAGKQRPFMAHTIVTIDLDPIPTLLRLGTPQDEQTARRRHEVRGHWCHSEALKRASRNGCIHSFVANLAKYPDDDPRNPDHWKCSACGGERWWRHAHARGDGSIGFVAKAYEVSTGREKAS